MQTRDRGEGQQGIPPNRSCQLSWFVVVGGRRGRGESEARLGWETGPVAARFQMPAARYLSHAAMLLLTHKPSLYPTPPRQRPPHRASSGRPDAQP